MAEACPTLTPEDQASLIVNGAKRAMMEKVHAAVAEAARQVREQLLAAGLDLAPTPKGYFNSVVHQQMYAVLCGADEETFEGGRQETAVEIIRNQQMIANHYWGARLELTQKAS